MKYEVTLKEIEIYILEVEADSHDEAETKAWDMLSADEQAKVTYHYDSDGEAVTVEIDE